MRKIKGTNDSDDDGYSNEIEHEDARQQGLIELEQLEETKEEAPKTGIFSMKFMQRGFEQQQKEAKAQILKAKKEFEGIDSDDEDEKQEQVTKGRQVFKHDPNAADKLGLKIAVESEFEIPTAIFEVPSFESTETDAQEKIEAKKGTVDISELKWVADDTSSLVKKSLKPVHEQFSRSNKTIKALAKLSNSKKDLLQQDTFQEGKIIVPEFDSSLPEAPKQDLMNTTNDVVDLKRADIMQMAFANDDIEAVNIQINI